MHIFYFVLVSLFLFLFFWVFLLSCGLKFGIRKSCPCKKMAMPSFDQFNAHEQLMYLMIWDDVSIWNSLYSVASKEMWLDQMFSKRLIDLYLVNSAPGVLSSLAPIHQATNNVVIHAGNIYLGPTQIHQFINFCQEQWSTHKRVCLDGKLTS